MCPIGCPILINKFGAPNRIKSIDNHYKTSDKYLSELTYKFIVEFEEFLRKHKPLDHHQTLNNNGIMKHIERFRKMINLAVTVEWMEKDLFVKFKQRFDKVEREFLTGEELGRIETKQFHTERMQQVKDLFVFSCYTGLSYIDVMNFTPSLFIKAGEDILKLRNCIWFGGQSSLAG